MGRGVSYRDDGLWTEPDAQHLDVVAAELGFDEAKGVATPGTRDAACRSAEHLRELR